MGLILFLLFLSIPLIEIAVFIEIGGLLGLWPTIAIVIATAALGAAMWRQQGLSTMARAQEALNQGELPVAEVMDGAFLLVAGALLLTPGFVTDAFGFLLFIPAFRQMMARGIFRRMAKSGKIHVHMQSGGHPRGGGQPHGGSQPRGPRSPHQGGTIIDGDATDLDDDRS